MKQCSKCKIDKEDNEFQKYWHSTQQKFRIRKECTLCHNTQHNERRRLKRLESKLIQVPIIEEIVQPVVQELQPDLSTNQNYKQCRTCQEWKLKSEYHQRNNSRKNYLDCKYCYNKKELERSRIDRLKELEVTGGSDRHKQQPGEWIDEYQKEATYNILKAIGWKLNEENGIWFKDGIKTSDGVFINIKTKPTKESFKDYPFLMWRNPQKKEIFDKAVALRIKGKTYKYIADELGLSDTTIYKWLNNEKH